MTASPTQQEYISASQATYLRVGSTPISVPGLTPLVGPDGQLVYASDDANGFYAAAYTDSAGNVIIAYEGSLPSQSTSYGYNSGLADFALLQQGTPQAFADAAAFANTVLTDAQALGISANQVYVTGHSLGGAEAEAAAETYGLSGATFGAPGIPGYTNSGSQPDLINYVAYGDPVGNYASDSSEEQGFAPSTGMDHVGTVQFVGNPSNAVVLQAASAAYSLTDDLTGQLVFAGLGLFLDLDNHSINNYGSALELTVPQGFDLAPGPYDILFALDAPLGASGATDFDAATLLNTGAVVSPDFTVNLSPDGSVCTIVQGSSIDASTWTSASDPGTLVADLVATESNTQTATFYDSSNGDVSDLTFDASTGAEEVATTDTPDGTSSTTSFDYTNSSTIFATTTSYAGPNGTGSITEVDRENTNGASQITTYNPDGSSTETYYTGPSGTGSVTETDQENANGTSQITIYDPGGSSTATTYSGPNGTGTATEVDQENANGTSQITTQNSYPDGDVDGVSTTAYYTGPNGTGGLAQVVQNNPDGTSQVAVYNPDGSASITEYNGPNGSDGVADDNAIVIQPGATLDLQTVAYPLVVVLGSSMPTSPEQFTIDLPNGQGDVTGEYETWVAPTVGYDDLPDAESDFVPGNDAVLGFENLPTVDQPYGEYSYDDFIILDSPYYVPIINIQFSQNPVPDDPNGYADGYVTAVINLARSVSYTSYTPGAVEKGETEVLGVVSPGFAGDTLTLTETSGTGTVSLGPVQSDGSQQVIYTAPASIPVSTTDTVDFLITESDGISVDIESVATLDAGPSLMPQTPSLVGPNQSTVIGVATPGLPGDTLDVIRLDPFGIGTVSLGPVQADGTQQVIYTAPASIPISETEAVHYTVFDEDGGDSVSGEASVRLFDVPCFLAGTLIRTPSGEQPVQELRVGDRACTLRGEQRSIKWIGSGRALVTRGKRNAATPVIVRKGAIADNVPCRDLRITKGHSLFIDDVLIPAEFLVNHRSILWDDHAQEVTIYHIELESHDVLIANGAPAESYRDDGNRWLFQNANSGWNLPPQEPCAPVLTGGPVVDGIWRRLLERTGPRRSLPLTGDADLHVVADGRRLDAAERVGDIHVFHLSALPSSLNLVSRAAAPAELGLARDPRVLGVALRRLVVRKGSRFRVTEADDDRLTEGFHRFETDNEFRWTDGDATIPAELFEGFTAPLELVAHVAMTARYLDEGRVQHVA